MPKAKQPRAEHESAWLANGRRVRRRVRGGCSSLGAQPALGPAMPAPAGEDPHGLALANLGLVWTIARMFKRKLPAWYEEADFLGAGYLGLMEAAHAYKSNPDAKFSSFAGYRIQGAILDFVGSEHWLHRNGLRRRQKIDRARCNLEQRLQRPAAEDEMADALGLALRRYQKLSDRLAGQLSSLDEGEIGTQEESDAWPRELREALHRELAELAPRDRALLHWRYFADCGPEEAAARIGVRPAYYQLLHSKLLGKLRARLREFIAGS